MRQIAVAVLSVAFFVGTALAELETRDVSTNIDNFVDLIKMCDECENNITVFDKGFAYETKVPLMGPVSVKAIIEYITVSGLKATKRRAGVAEYWNKTDYNSYLQLKFGTGPLNISAESETKFFGFKSDRNYTGKIDYVETDIRIRCSKMVDKVLMDTFKINKFEGFDLKMEGNDLAARWLPQSVIKQTLRLLMGNVEENIKQMLRDHFRREVPKWSDAFKPMLCH